MTHGTMTSGLTAPPYDTCLKKCDTQNDIQLFAVSLSVVILNVVAPLGTNLLCNQEEINCIMCSFPFSDSFLVAHPESFLQKTHKFSVPANGYIAYIFYFFHHFNENFLKRLPGLGSE